jgi:hypothetical protein
VEAALGRRLFPLTLFAASQLRTAAGLLTGWVPGGPHTLVLRLRFEGARGTGGVHWVQCPRHPTFPLTLEAAGFAPEPGGRAWARFIGGLGGGGGVPRARAVG